MPDAPQRSSGTVPVGYAYGRNLEHRGVMHVPWNRASVLHRKGKGHFDNPVGIGALVEQVDVDPAVVEAKQASLPRPVRRTARQRAQVLATELFKTAMLSQQVYGYVRWPDSIERVIDDLGLQTRSMYEQVDGLVGHYMLKIENKQKASDARKTVRDWHGHYD